MVLDSFCTCAIRPAEVESCFNVPGLDQCFLTPLWKTGEFSRVSLTLGKYCSVYAIITSYIFSVPRDVREDLKSVMSTVLSLVMALEYLTVDALNSMGQKTLHHLMTFVSMNVSCVTTIIVSRKFGLNFRALKHLFWTYIACSAAKTD